MADLILSDSMPLFDVKIDVDPDDSTYILKVCLRRYFVQGSITIPSVIASLRNSIGGTYETEIYITFIF